MPYSNTRIPNDPSLFPAPQTYMTWVADYDWQNRKAQSSGRLRHYHTLAKAKRALAWIGSKSRYATVPGVFLVDWALYHWEEGEWVEVYHGNAGDLRDDNPLFQRRLSKAEKEDPLMKSQEEAAISSILTAVQKAS